MFDEAITRNNRKQMELILRFWNENRNLVVTRYMTSLRFGSAKALISQTYY